MTYDTDRAVVLAHAADIKTAVELMDDLLYNFPGALFVNMSGSPYRIACVDIIDGASIFDIIQHVRAYAATNGYLMIP
jgi:hypothetical protein